jgi:hypothetical protein
MAKDTCDRYESMIDLSVDLEKCIEDADYLPSYSQYNYRVTDLERTGKLDRTALDWSPESGVHRKRKKSRIGLTVAILSVLVLLGGAGAAYWTGHLPFSKENVLRAEGEISVVNQEREGATEAVDEEKDSVKPSEEVESDKTDDPTGEEYPDDLPMAEPKIAVTIKTKPKGALVTIEGLGQVCSSTPCDVELPWGTPVAVEATLDNRSKQITFTPSPQNRELSLTLKRSRSGGRRGGKRPDTKTGSGSATRDNGLKIPKIFENN